MRIINRFIPFSIIAFFYCVIHLVFLQQYPLPLVDEPWYANTAYNILSHNQIANTNAGIGGGDLFIFYVYPLSWFFKWVGIGWLEGRLFSILIGFFSLAGIYAIGQRLKWRSTTQITVGILAASSHVLWVIFRTIRPEALLALQLIFALLALIRFYQDSKLRDAFWCGLFVGMGCFTHPLALTPFLVLSTVTIGIAIRRRLFKPIFAYAGGGLICAAVFFTTLFIGKGETILTFFSTLTQVTDRLSTGSNIFDSFWGTFVPFLLNYTLGWKRLLMFVVEIGVLVWGLVWFRARSVGWFLSAVGLSLFFTGQLIFHPFSKLAFFHVIIPSLLVIGCLVESVSGRKQLGLAGLLIVYFVNTLGGNLYILSKTAHHDNYTDIIRRVRQSIPENQLIITQLELWFARPESQTITQHTRWPTKFNSEKLTSFLNSNSGYYVALAQRFDFGSGKTEEGIAAVTDQNLGSYYQVVSQYAAEKGSLIDDFSAKGYGKISIWKID